MTAELARVLNLRDLGGVQTQDGHRLRPGLLYRSASLCELTPAQTAAIRAFNIDAIIDLRANSERAKFPTLWQDIGCRRYHFHDHEPPRDRDLNSLIDDGGMTAEAARTRMLNVYRTMPFRLVEAMRRLFDAAARGGGAVLFHCTAGKDRTGIAAAVLLSALNVSREAILADYMATMTYDILASPAFRRDRTLNPEREAQLRPMLDVSEAYLTSSFDEIAVRHGSIEAFLSDVLGVGTENLTELRGRLLEPSHNAS